ncbi:hypothetical protein PACTADRAFT_64664 [Pachysolen tannophilus NRRL Y-2460]|uniref:D-lactate dehydrogenase (cytochrome) n=1 Tax=Pachysolen tannophilus NRRL Y-2460 TaxID=669874 RepID=A0A1E4U3G8_PACTA|nr:hypothetical protein PACTADRAFT_64664 [Pachysolen tannophilus NRRL Y-2460]
MFARYFGFVWQKGAHTFKRPVKFVSLRLPKYTKCLSYSTAPPNARRNNSSTRLLVVSVLLSTSVGWFACDYYTKKIDPPEYLFPLSSTTDVKSLKPPIYASKDEVKLAIDEIEKILGPENITSSAGELLDHSDNSSNFHKPHESERPYLVCYPTSIEKVQAVVKVCFKYRVPMIPIGGKTSIEGHMIPTHRGIAIDISRMDKIVEFHEDDLDIVVQPGIGWVELNEFLAPYNLLFGPDPCKGAQCGGICATNASGTNASRFGAAKDNVISLTVVLADGSIIKTKQRPRKSSAGYNLTNLFIGSEGTLGIIVEATLKLHVKPKHEIVAMMNFNSLSEATHAVTDIFKKGIQVNACELLDSRQMKVIQEMDVTTRKYSDKNLLLFKFGSGSDKSLKEIVSQVKGICFANGGFNYEVAYTEEQKENIWDIRKSQLWITIDWAKSLNPKMKFCPTDSAVPVSSLPQAIEDTVKDIEENGLLTTVVAHAADGNFHALVIFPPEKLEVAQQVIKRMASRAIQYGGTCSGEHGIGIGKREFLVEELGANSIDLMRKLKMAMDPLRLLNPDKVFITDPSENRTECF